MKPPSSSANHLHGKPRRFYAEVAVAAADGGFAVQLDGRTAKTPAGAKLALPTEALAGLVAAEWAGQGELVDFDAMPATRLAFTVIDRAADAHAAMARQIADYAGSDLICYFAEGPAGLVARQEALWGPWLAWGEKVLDLDLVRAVGVIHCEQPARTLARVESMAFALDDFALSAVALAAGLFGSAILALALERGAVSGAEAFALSRLDEAFQEERWGVDEEAAARTAARAAEAQMLERWFKALA
jgi:chaperone required for assembly of F1-ATPase